MPMNTDDYLHKAEAICYQRSARFTALRRRVLQLVLEAGQPLGAYAVLDLLKADDKEANRKAAPPTVYRALDFLQQHGLIHRIASHNTYIVCDHPGHHHGGLFLVCSQCGTASETASHAVTDAITAVARAQGFAVQSENIELTGLCRHCQTSTGQPA